jgi:glycosyltransferase involved in cell wall biosynthesis
VTRFKVVMNGGACAPFIARAIGSLLTQGWRDWDAVVTIDPCGDDAYERAVEAAGGDGRIAIVRNDRRLYAMENVVRAVRRSGEDPQDIVVILDADDWLATGDALEIVARTYAKHDAWLTYGSWASNVPSGNQGRWPPYADDTTDFRRSEWRGTALRTFKRWLFDRIDDRDLRDGDGHYFRIVEDQAYMLPMLEMATTRRARYIAEVLMIYNRENPHAVGATMLEEMRRTAAAIRARKAYGALIADSCISFVSSAPAQSSTYQTPTGASESNGPAADAAQRAARR